MPRTSFSNTWSWIDDFVGAGTFGAAGVGVPWAIVDTSVGGTPTYAAVNPSSSGEIAVTLVATNEIENVCLAFGDVLCFSIGKIIDFEWRIKLGAATMPTASLISFGMTSARNDAIASITNSILFQVDGATDTTACVITTRDGVHTNSAVSTGTTLINAYKLFRVDFTNGTTDVRFFIDNAPVATGTTFDLSNYTGSMQPFLQLQKTVSVNVPVSTADYFRISGNR